MVSSTKIIPFTFEENLLMSAGAFVIISGCVLGSQIAGGVFVGLVSASGVAYTILKTRQYAPRIFNCIVSNPLASDLIIDAGVFILVGSSTVTGIVAGASASLFTSIALNCIRRLGEREVHSFNLPRKLSALKLI